MKAKRDMYIGIFSFLLGVIYLIMAWNLPTSFVGSSRAHVYLPLGVGLIMSIAGLSLYIKNYKILKATKESVSNKKSNERKHYKLIIITIILSFLYAYFFEKAGYIISTSVFLTVMLLILRGLKKWISSIIIAVGFSYFIFFTFGNFLEIYLPTL